MSKKNKRTTHRTATRTLESSAISLLYCWRLSNSGRLLTVNSFNFYFCWTKNYNRWILSVFFKEKKSDLRINNYKHPRKSPRENWKFYHFFSSSFFFDGPICHEMFSFSLERTPHVSPTCFTKNWNFLHTRNSRRIRLDFRLLEPYKADIFLRHFCTKNAILWLWSAFDFYKSSFIHSIDNNFIKLQYLFFFFF